MNPLLSPQFHCPGAAGGAGRRLKWGNISTLADMSRLRRNAEALVSPRSAAFWGVLGGVCAVIATAYLVIDHLPVDQSNPSSSQPAVVEPEYQDELILKQGRFFDLDTDPPSDKQDWDDTVDLYSGRDYWSTGLYLFAISEEHDATAPAPTAGTAAIAVWTGDGEPTYAQCRDLVLQKGWTSSKEFGVGGTLCLSTDHHRIALMRVEDITADDRITLQVKVWAPQLTN